MKNKLPFLCIATLAATPFAQASQDQGQDREAQQRETMQGSTTYATAPSRHVRIETLIGADVELGAKMHTEGEYGTTEDEYGTTEQDSESSATGEVQDLIVSSNGDIEWAVVSCDGHETLVPPHKLQWHAEDESFHLSISKSEFESKPEFDLSKARESGMENAIASVESAWDSAMDASPREASASEAPTTMGSTKLHGSNYQPVVGKALLCGSELDELEVYGIDEEFGGVSKTFIDPDGMRVDLVVVSRGGVASIGATEYLIPFRALTVCHESLEEGESAEDAERMLCCGRSATELEQAPEYEEPEGDDTLVSAANRAEAMSFFGVSDDTDTSFSGDERDEYGSNEDYR